MEPATTELPSRVAENLFWLGRYVERAEHIVRLLRSFVSRLADQDTTDDPRQVSALLQVLVGLRVLPEELGEDTLLRKIEEDTIDLFARQGPHTGLRTRLERGAAPGERGARPLVHRHLENPEPAASGHAAAAGPHPVRRSARPPERHHHGPGGLQRHGDGEHDAGARLALPESWPAAGAIGQSHRGAAGGARLSRGRRGRRDRRAAARNRRQLDDLPPPLLRPAAARTGAAPAAADDTNTRGLAFQLAAVVGAHPPPAARSAGAVADARGAIDRPGARHAGRGRSSSSAWSGG